MMANDVATPSNPLVVLVEEEKPKEASLDVNVSQWLRKEESSKRVVHIRVDRSTWDHQLFPNPHALVIYLKFVHARGAMLERFEKCYCENDNVCFHCRTWIPGDGHYYWLQCPINPLSMEHQVEYLVHTIRHILDFLQL